MVDKMKQASVVAAITVFVSCATLCAQTPEFVKSNRTNIHLEDYDGAYKTNITFHFLTDGVTESKVSVLLYLVNNITFNIKDLWITGSKLCRAWCSMFTTRTWSLTSKARYGACWIIVGCPLSSPAWIFTRRTGPSRQPDQNRCVNPFSPVPLICGKITNLTWRN